jgi:hypothetical protein
MALAHVTNILLDTEVSKDQSESIDASHNHDGPTGKSNVGSDNKANPMPNYPEDFHYHIDSYRHVGNEDMVISRHDYEGHDICTSPSLELLAWHQRFGHVSMVRLQQLASEGVLPRRIAKCAIPL